MKKHLALWLIASGWLSSLSADGGAPASDPPLDLTTALKATSPHLTGGPVGNDRYVIETSDLGSKQTRWSFNDIRPDSFVWRDEASNDGGKTWTLQSEYRMKRRRAS